jgi:co-chaperonin GroES (HSP10)
MITPRNDNVLILMDWHRDARADTFSSGGILLPGQAKKPKELEAVPATVVACGPGRHIALGDKDGPDYIGTSHFVPCPVQPGDRVLVDWAAQGDPIVVDGVEHRIIRQHNILGVIEEEGEAA